MEQMSDVSTINSALKAICRELGVERDRQSVLHIATLLVRLVKEGDALTTEQLISTAREHLCDVARSSSWEGSALS